MRYTVIENCKSLLFPEGVTAPEAVQEMTSNCNFRKSENTQDKFKMLEVDYRSTPFNGEVKPGKCV